MHPVHETISEVQWNVKSSCVEVAIRLDKLDEQWILKHVAEGKVESDVESDVGNLTYLRQRYRVSPLPKKDQKDESVYRWVGRQTDGAHVWWYFEIEPPAKARPVWLEIKVLFDHTGDYQHRIVFVAEVPKRSVNLDRQKPRASFQPPLDPKQK